MFYFMSSESERVNHWTIKFDDFLRTTNPDLLPLFATRLMFFPKEDGQGGMESAYTPLDERYATKEQIQRMEDVFEKFSSENPI
jgi:hypothetical protein